MKNAPVDVLLIEKRPIGPSHALAASRAADNLVLLGDPLQLPKSPRPHPVGAVAASRARARSRCNDAGRSRSVPDPERRMHPDVCSFISKEIYEGRLFSHASCEQQTPSSEPACAGSRHTTRTEPPSHQKSRHRRSPDRPNDRHHVGPTNAARSGHSPSTTSWWWHLQRQVNLIRARSIETNAPALSQSELSTSSGRQAAIVLFTMATSAGIDMTGPRTSCSPKPTQRCISRAGVSPICLHRRTAQQPRPRYPEIRLISTLCAFVEYSQTTDTN